LFLLLNQTKLSFLIFCETEKIMGIKYFRWVSQIMHWVSKIKILNVWTKNIDYLCRAKPKNLFTCYYACSLFKLLLKNIFLNWLSIEDKLNFRLRSTAELTLMSLFGYVTIRHTKVKFIFFILVRLKQILNYAIML
jgi:hypothetical protein